MFRWSTQWDLTSSAMSAGCVTATLAPNTDVVLRTRPSRYLPRLNPPNLSCRAYPTLWMLRSVHHSRTFQRFICVLHCTGRRRIVSPCSANTLIGTCPAAVHVLALQQRDGPPRTCLRTRGAPPCRGWRPGTRSTAARGWRRRACPRTRSSSRRRAARCRTACRWARGRWLRYRTLTSSMSLYYYRYSIFCDSVECIFDFSIENFETASCG